MRNNFTTPEQSKRLLEFGIPADSADCYFFDWKAKFKGIIQRDVLPDDVSYEEWIIQPDSFGEVHTERYLPCWSIGRLVEILSICCSYRYYLPVDYCTVEYIVAIISYEIKLNRIDFSKLEE